MSRITVLLLIQTRRTSLRSAGDSLGEDATVVQERTHFMDEPPTMPNSDVPVWGGEGREVQVRVATGMRVWARGRYTPLSRGEHSAGSINPFTPKSDQFQIPPATSPEILHHTVWRTWLFIAYSDERWLYYQFSLPHFSWGRLGECTFWTWEWKGPRQGCSWSRSWLNRGSE